MKRSKVKRYYLLGQSNHQSWRNDVEPQWRYMAIKVSTTLIMYRFPW